MRTSDTNFFVDTINKNVVRAGLEKDAVVHIGRIAYQGEVVVGKIPTNDWTKASLFIVNKDSELKMTSFEVLIYDNKLM